MKIINFITNRIELHSIVYLKGFFCCISISTIVFCKPSWITFAIIEIIKNFLIIFYFLRSQQITFTKDFRPDGKIIGYGVEMTLCCHL